MSTPNEAMKRIVKEVGAYHHEMRRWLDKEVDDGFGTRHPEVLAQLVLACVIRDGLEDIVSNLQ